MRQASRFYVRRHARPRDGDGRFSAGYELWTRTDGQSRWIRWLRPDDSEHRVSRLNEDALRHLIVLAFVVVVAAVTALVVR